MCVLSSVFSFEETQRHCYCFTVVLVGRLRDPPRPTIIVEEEPIFKKQKKKDINILKVFTMQKHWVTLFNLI